MTATVRLNKHQSDTLERLAATLNRQKSEILRDALAFYASRIENEKTHRIQKAVQKTYQADKQIHDEIAGTIHDGL